MFGQPKGKQLMNFQTYLKTLNNNVDENVACKKYKDFLASFTQSTVGRFFESNKDREWFRLKYHPIDSQKFLQQQNASYLKRLKIFNDLNDRHYFDTLSYSIENSTQILNLMDAIIVRLQDGPEELVEQLLNGHSDNVDPQLRENYIPSQPTSIVIDDVSIEATLAEIQELCLQASPDLVHITQLDPFYTTGGQLRRKLVVIYKNSVDIKEVCWKLSRLKLHNKELNVSINRGIRNRIKSVDALSNHHISIINDIRHAIVLILNFDEVKGIFARRKNILEGKAIQAANSEADITKMDVSSNNDDGRNHDTSNDAIDHVAPLSPPGSEKSVNNEGDDEEKPFDINTLDEDKEKEKKKLIEIKFDINISLHQQIIALKDSRNQILEGAFNYLIRYAESLQALYYISKVPKDLQCEEPFITDDYIDNKINDDKFYMIEMIIKYIDKTAEESTKFLDKMLWYLRIVHSYDYYKSALYKLEDELTLKMGIIHLRGFSSEEMESNVSNEVVKEYLKKFDAEFESFGRLQSQKYLSKDEERFNYKSYGKMITDELASYAQRIQKSKSNETEEVYKCKHCTRVFQKLTDIGRHFVGKHRWAIDAIELETDFFNTYLFDCTKINPCPPKELLEVPPNRFARLNNLSQMEEEADPLQETLEAYSKMDSFVREPAPRTQVESDPRNEMMVDYTDISFDDAI